jgi:transcriptional regulator with XRE-family HTH domain
MHWRLKESTKIFMAISKKTAVDWKAVGRRLRELRGFDMNQAEFARQLGISQSQFSRYEKGDSEISAETLLRISQKFAKSIEWLLTGKEP